MNYVSNRKKCRKFWFRVSGPNKFHGRVLADWCPFFTPDMTLYGKQVSSASNHFQFQIPNKNNWIVYNMLSLMNKTHDMLSYKNKFSFLLTNIYTFLRKDIFDLSNNKNLCVSWHENYKYRTKVPLSRLIKWCLNKI